MRRLNRTYLLVAILFFGLVAGAWTFVQAQIPQRDETLLTIPVRRGPIEETVSATGVLEPSELVQVGAQVTGQLKAIHVSLGDEVRTGDLIAEIDSVQQQNELRLARASLAEARATRRMRQFQFEKARRALTRQQELYAGRASSGAELQDAELAVRSAQADLDASAAQIERATVEMEKADANLGYTRIVAPIDGRVLSLADRSGQTLNAVQTTPVIAIIARTDVMTVRVQVSEVDVGRIKPGQKVYFTTFSDRRTRRESVLGQVEPAPPSILSSQAGAGERQGGTSAQAVYYNALFDAPNTDGTLMPMMTAEVTISVGAAENALLAPWQALQGPDEGGRHTVRVRTADGRLEDRQVRTGVTNRVDIEILEGLSEGEEVVLQAAPGFADMGMLTR